MGVEERKRAARTALVCDHDMSSKRHESTWRHFTCPLVAKARRIGPIDIGTPLSLTKSTFSMLRVNKPWRQRSSRRAVWCTQQSTSIKETLLPLWHRLIISFARPNKRENDSPFSLNKFEMRSNSSVSALLVKHHVPVQSRLTTSSHIPRVIHYEYVAISGARESDRNHRSKNANTLK